MIESMAVELHDEQPADPADVSRVPTAARFLTVEPPDPAGNRRHRADALDPLAAVLVDAHVFDDLSPADANRVAETVAFDAICAEWALADEADAVTLDRDADRDDRMG
jgi:hypothetical protein